MTFGDDLKEGDMRSCKIVPQAICVCSTDSRLITTSVLELVTILFAEHHRMLL